MHPSYSTHGMTDNEPFWRASMAPVVKWYPFKRVPKVAFMFLTPGQLPLSLLWDRFFKGHEGLYSVYVHADPGHKLTDQPEESAFYGRLIPSKEVQLGSITLLDAERRLLANALFDISNERFILLSDSCVPVFDFQTVYKYLINSSTSFVQSYKRMLTAARGIITSKWTLKSSIGSGERGLSCLK